MDKKWHTLKLYEIEKQLNTSLEAGLSVREARARLDDEKKRADGERYSLFVPKRTSPLRILFSFFISPSVPLLILIALLSFIFGASTGALLTLLTAAAGALICGLILLDSEKRQAQMYEYASPMLKVKRGGSTMYTDGRNAVVGDVIVLSVGDILPCDARIISSNGLSVRELIHTKDGIRNRDVVKSACDISEESGINAPDAENMLYAGSAVMSGDAVAVVVSTAEDVCLAKYCGGSLLRTEVFSQSEEKSIDGFFRKLLFFSFLLLTFLSLLSMLTMQGEGFLSAFLMLLASVSLISAEVVKTVKACIFSSYLVSIAKRSKRKTDTSAYIRDIKTVETLSNVTDIVLLGKAAFTYGTYHIGGMCLFGELCDPIKAGEPGSRLMSYVYTYLKALDGCEIKTELVLDGVCDSLYEYLKNINFDKTGADLVRNSLYFAPNSDGTGGYACAETPEGAYRLMLTYDRDILTYCSHMRMRDQKLCELRSAPAAPLEELERATSDGCGKCLYIVTETDGTAVFEGALSLIETKVDDIDDMVCGMQKMGINTIPMISDKASGALLNSSKAFSENIAYAEEFKSNGHDITHDLGKYSAYVGFSDEEHVILIDFMRKQGATVAAYGVGNEYYGAMSHADVAISCDILKYSSQKYRDSVYEKLPQEGRDTSIRCSQKTRFLSKMLIRRASKTGGGLGAVKEAVLKARCANAALGQSLLYYASIMSILLPLSAMSCVLGIELLNGVQTACLSAAAVILSANVFAGAQARPDIQSRGRAWDIREILRDRKNSVMLIIRAALAAVFAISVKILDVIGVFGEDASYSMPVFISMIVIAAAELFVQSLKFTKKGGGRRRTLIWFLAVYSSLLALCGVMTLELFANELFPNGIGTLEFCLLPIYIFVHVSALFIFNIATRKKN